MTLKIFSIYDKKAEIHLRPFVETSIVSATRAVESALRGEKNQLSEYASDYRLVQIGEFDEEKGLLTNKNEIIAELSQLQRKS